MPLGLSVQFSNLFYHPQSVQFFAILQEQWNAGLSWIKKVKNKMWLWGVKSAWEILRNHRQCSSQQWVALLFLNLQWINGIDVLWGKKSFTCHQFRFMDKYWFTLYKEKDGAWNIEDFARKNIFQIKMEAQKSIKNPKFSTPFLRVLIATEK